VNPFSRFVRQAMNRKKINQIEFAKILQIKQSMISQILTGRRRLPPERLAEWTQILGLSDSQCKRFQILSLLIRCPPEIQAHVEKLERKKGFDVV